MTKKKSWDRNYDAAFGTKFLELVNVFKEPQAETLHYAHV
jgi:hypothetical protein